MIRPTLSSVLGLLAIGSASIAADGPCRILVVPASARPLFLNVPAPSGVTEGAWQLVEQGGDGARVDASLMPRIGADGSVVEGSQNLIATIPAAQTKEIRRFALESVSKGPNPAFRFGEISDRSLGLWDGDRPIYAYNHGIMNKEGVPADRNRGTYFHPVYDLDGAILTDDFPKDHYHHRGLFWAWPHVVIGGKDYDLWTLGGIRQKFDRWLAREVGPSSAVLGVENGWYIGDHRAVRERVWLVTYPVSDGVRILDFSCTLEPIGEPATLDGAEGKSYGGLNLRFAPGTDRVITTPKGNGPGDLLMTRLAWGDLSQAPAEGKPAGAAIFVARDHPDYPPTWLTRHYGVLCVGWPGVTPTTLEPGKPVTLKYRVAIHRGSADASMLEELDRAYQQGNEIEWEGPRVLVYTRNYTPDGKGYVHANIADSVAAIRKLGEENGFAVDPSDDPGVFTPENLRRYKAIVFSNSNNEAFASEAQRQTFQGYIRAGGGLVGIHSASGSERSWPYFWGVMGGKFRRHPKLQKFSISVKDAEHPATRGLPASFDWEDECYFLEFLNPDIHPLLVTDPTRLDDPGRSKFPGELFGHALPLAWTLQADGGRTFYTSLGHKSEHYKDPNFLRHLLGGIRWAMGQAGPAGP
ncbi:MAG: ThuA domain-containing protein [Isosphaeraceae bacterium]